MLQAASKRKNIYVFSLPNKLNLYYTGMIWDYDSIVKPLINKCWFNTSVTSFK